MFKLFNSFLNALLGRVEYQVIVIGYDKKEITEFLNKVVKSSMPTEFNNANIIKFQKDTVMIICAYYPACVSQQTIAKLTKQMDNNIHTDVYILKSQSKYMHLKNVSIYYVD